MERYEIFADYFQFYIQDEAADGNLSNAWSEEATARLLAVAPGTVGIGTVRNMEVPVTIQILDKEPGSDLGQWDHVVECTLKVTTPRLVIAGCTDYFPDAARIAVTPGVYRVRACFSGLDSISEDGLDGEDKYELQLWPAAAIEPRILKQHAVQK